MISTHITLIVKVTNSCNMSCRYCFIEPAVFHKKMTIATARRIIRAFLDSDHFESVHFVWHGGEPLLRNREFFNQIFREQRSRPTKVEFTNATQTNATYLDDEMMAFLVAQGVQIGLSLDGPQQLNDCSRQMRGADPRSPYQITIDAASRLRNCGCVPGAIVVVNRNNVDEPETVYREFKRQRLNMKLNCLTWSGLGATTGLDLAISPEAYGAFLVRMFDLWYDDPEPTITVEPFRQHICRILGIPGTVHSCYFTQGCHHHFLGISPDGDLFPCGMFQAEPAFRYGNINEMEPQEVGSTALFRQLESRERKVLQGCARCAFLDLCYGGCMFHALKNSQVFEVKDFYCPAYRIYFEHAHRRIHAELSRAQQTHPVSLLKIKLH